MNINKQEAIGDISFQSIIANIYSRFHWALSIYEKNPEISVVAWISSDYFESLLLPQ